MSKKPFILSSKKIEKKIYSRLLLSLLPMLAMVVMTYHTSKNLPENNKIILQLISENGANEIKRFLQVQREIFNHWIQNDIFGMSIEFQTFDELQKHFNHLQQSYRIFSHLLLTDVTGKKIIDLTGDKNAQLSSQTILNLIEEHKHFKIFEHYVCKNRNPNNACQYTCIFGFQTMDTNGNHNGYFLAAIDWSRMHTVVKGIHDEIKQKGFENARMALIELETGHPISQSSFKMSKNKIFNEKALDLWIREGKNQSFQKLLIDNQNHYVSFLSVDPAEIPYPSYESHLCLAVFVPEKSIMTERRTIVFISALSAFICSLFVILVGFLIIRGVKGPLDLAVAEINTASEELKIAAKHQLSNTANQVTSTSELNTNIEEQVASSRQLADIAYNFVAAAEATNTSANLGKNSLENTVSGIEIIKTQVEKIAENMLSLNEKTQQMSLALDIINELSAQTTILSYNATIEAVGAGDAGKRFSAIAEQIMKLANKATESTKDISVLVEDIQKGGNKTILTTEDGIKSVENGMQMILETVDHFDSIQTSADQNLISAKEMDMTISQQKLAIEQAADAIRNIQNAAEDVKNSSEETLRTAEQMLSMSRKLAEL
jgi:hypothetical protein